MAVTMAAAMAACARVEEPLSSDGETRQVTLSVNIPQSDLDSKAAGDGTQVNRCILQIYCGEDKYGALVVESVAGGTADFKLQLVTGQDYKFVLWADAGGSNNSDNHYDTTRFPEVAFKGDYTGNDDSWDAFCANVEITGFNGTLEPVTLTRPFGQLNIYTEDIDEIKAGTLEPDKVRVKFNSIPASYDIISGVSSGEREIEYTAKVVETSDEDSDGKYLLSTDYIFAPDDGQLILDDFTMSFLNAAGQSVVPDYTFKNIPVQRNYRTNVSGNLLTKTGILSVTVDADFDSPEIEKEVRAVAALSEVKAALDNGADIVDVTGDAYGDLVLPAVDRDITVNLKGSVTGNVTVKSDEDKYTGHFTISNETEGDNSHDLVINLPNGSASVDGKWNDIDVTTADNTFVLESSSEVCTLTVKKGNVELYGKVKKALIKGEGYTGTIYRCLSDQLSMDNLLDDDYSGYTKVLIERPAEVSGGEKEKELTVPVEIYSDAEISNLKIKPSAESKVVDVVSVYGEGNDVVLDNCEIYQLFNGSGTTTTSAVRVSGKSQEVSVLNCQIVLDTKFYMQRGINISAATDAEVTVENTHIGVSTDYLPEEYTDQQISAFVGRYDSRGISLHNNVGHTVLNIRNKTVVEGAFYAVNWAGASEKVTVNVDDSRLDGRCAFNINSGNDNNVYVTSSKLIGRNYFTGPTENFAVIVYGYDCEGTDVSVTGNSEIISYNSPQTATNWQFSASLRSPNCGLSLHDVTIREKKTGDVEPRMSFAVDDQYPESNTITSSNVSFDGKEYLQLLPRTVWDGSLKTVPMQTLLSMTDDETQNKYKYSAYLIIQPSDLAWVAEQVNEGNEDARKMSLCFKRDIDLGGHSWIPIGYNGNSNINMDEDEYAQTPMFRGSIFGNRHIISNAVVDVKTTARGVFGQVYGDSEAENPTVIYDLNAENIHVKQAGKWSGGLFGYIRNVSIISGCSIKDVTIETGNNPESYFCGGLIGYITSTDGVTVKGCFSENITFPGPETWNCGGLIGKIFGCGDVLIQDCEASKGYMKSYFFNNGQLTGYPGSNYYIATDGYQNSWFIGNLTNTSGFNLTIDNVPNYSGHWTENDSNGGGSIPVGTLSNGAFSWPFIGVFDGNSNTTDATIIVNGRTVFPVQ